MMLPLQMGAVLTFDPGLQLLLHEFFGWGEVTQSDFWRAVTLAHWTNHLLLFLLAPIGVYVDPRYFPDHLQRLKISYGPAKPSSTGLSQQVEAIYGYKH